MAIIVEHSSSHDARSSQQTVLQDVRTVGQAIERVQLARDTGFIILVNGRVGHWNTELKDGDLLQIIPAISGG